MTHRNFVCLLAAFVFVACNPHPVQPLEGVVSAVNRQSSKLPEKTKIDFLCNRRFGVDDRRASKLIAKL